MNKAEKTVSLFIMFVCCLVYFAEFKGWKGLRSIPVQKSIWLALIWTIITVAIPLNKNFYHDARFIFTERFLFMLSLCIIYNLRDNTVDLTKGFRTIAGVIGATGTKKISLALLSLNAIVIFMHHYNFAISLAFIVSLIATAFIILLAKEDGHPLYYSFAVDASMIVQSVLVLIAYYSV